MIDKNSSSMEKAKWFERHFIWIICQIQFIKTKNSLNEFQIHFGRLVCGAVGETNKERKQRK